MTGGYNANGNIKRICPQGLNVQDYGNPYFSIQPVAPNPFSTTATLTYSMLQNAPVHIGLYDLSGKEVAVLVDGAQQSGQHTFQIDAQKLGLAPGMYFCLMNSNNYTESVKISVVK